jgi:O-acetyl-ADP-ribose deacetylase (regulator of RNase III)
VKQTINHTMLELLRGDITEMDTEAIVNAANRHLQHGGGVAGAIVRKGGRVIQEESDRIGGVEVGDAAITGAGKLKAKHVVHAVGPMMGEGDEDRKLASATRRSLEIADAHGLRSVAFPAISTGIFGYPIDRCARIMLKTAIDYLEAETGLERVVFCLYDERALRVFSLALGHLRGA